MTDTTSINVAVGGVAMPFIIALINQATWSPKLKGVVAFFACLFAAAALAALNGTLTLSSWRDTAVIVTGAAMVMYHALWRPSGIATAVENATTVGSSPADSDTPSTENSSTGLRPVE